MLGGWLITLLLVHVASAAANTAYEGTEHKETNNENNDRENKDESLKKILSMAPTVNS